jgi:hypothetical protein
VARQRGVITLQVVAAFSASGIYAPVQYAK